MGACVLALALSHTPCTHPIPAIAVSCSILEDLFWYVHCVCFQPDTTARDQAVLLQRVSVSYVRMLRLITSNKDYFFEVR